MKFRKYFASCIFSLHMKKNSKNPCPYPNVWVKKKGVLVFAIIKPIFKTLSAGISIKSSF